MESLLTEDFNYDLPSRSIAMFPLRNRDESKLLVFKEESLHDSIFKDLPDYLPRGSTLILNNTRVINARLIFSKPSGGRIELFCLEPFDSSFQEGLAGTSPVRWKCLIGGASKWPKGQILEKALLISNIDVTVSASYIGKQENYFIIEFSWSSSELTFSEILRQVGLIPLPPYIKRKPIDEDARTYQTVFNQEEGSVAAPTAALHFTETLFSSLASKNISCQFITLHVGAGTFKPLTEQAIEKHLMHSEPFSVSMQVLQQLMIDDTVIAVGTTSLRTIESIYWIGVKLLHNIAPQDWSLSQWEPYHLTARFPTVDVKQSIGSIIKWMEINNTEQVYCRTSLMVVPGYQFKVVKGLITNFHQPKSTLLVLISAFIGSNWKKAYRHALDNDYRFLSYGDSSLLWRPD